ncbi:hypothetical protein [Bacillus thuringiensis]|uniref:hypothetical protein n=1 Tax=Bacillus cereus group TaxID=86661 RepID=UPI0005AF1D77|nr:hypothetical protein [Bacillus thuringiensis]MCU5281614.1 hypothetical protein [Bacillus cereus]AMR88348.1 hypothetical protein A3L20_30525 [Bacillus thuringiensis]AMR88437.1 hypothetical protein A3L20_31005 [Bacillus thuringiensis]KIP28326.1 hypothetical protein BG10_1681 [Bacillus thuringiensis serovar morrisoni]MBG9640426.1 hypothetical protein [Bacillus thuringiensis]
MRSLGKSIGEPLITKYLQATANKEQIKGVENRLHRLKGTAKEKHDFQEFNNIQNLNRKSNYQKQELNDFIGNEEMKTKIKRELQKAK